MEAWKERLITPMPDEPQGVSFYKSILLRLTPSGARALTEHADKREVPREQWIREAIYEKMKREGADHIPEMRPYRGHRLLKAVEW